jgi:hypothetical protein
MRGTIPPLAQYAFMGWCSVKRSTGTTLPLHTHTHTRDHQRIFDKFLHIQFKLDMKETGRSTYSEWVTVKFVTTAAVPPLIQKFPD